MKEYAFNEIRINGRSVSLAAITAGRETPMTAFEARTFELIHDWLNGRETFQINTSGSTGQPKPIVIHRDQMIMSSKLSGEALGLRPGFDSLICIDTRFIGGTMMIIRSLVLNLYIQAVEPNEIGRAHV